MDKNTQMISQKIKSILPRPKIEKKSSQYISLLQRYIIKTKKIQAILGGFSFFSIRKKTGT